MRGLESDLRKCVCVCACVRVRVYVGVWVHLTLTASFSLTLEGGSMWCVSKYVIVPRHMR